MSDNIGTRLRQARESKNMSLRSLASAIGVSPSLLSQIETGKTKPSVSTLYSLVSELDISTDALLGREEHYPAASPAQTSYFSAQPTQSFLYQSSQENPTLEMDNGVKWERLSVLEGTDVEALRVTYQPGASSSIEGRLMRHFGIEHVYMLNGELTLRLEFEAHKIGPGDSMVFNSERPHLFVNESTVPAVGIWYITGRQGATQQHAAPLENPSETHANGAPLNSAVDVLRSFRA